MSVVKSLSVGNGDMFYIKHNVDSFTIIDCCLPDDIRTTLINEIVREKEGKGIVRFLSTHPDEDHIYGLTALDDEIGIVNFYCVNNETTKEEETDDFKRYCRLRDSEKSFSLEKGCSRKWLNSSDDERQGAGITILWPDPTNQTYKDALAAAKAGEGPNNISPIIKYSLNGGATILWMGDLEQEFMENIKNDVDLPKVNVLFAPHHGRKTGTLPTEWLELMSPDIIVMGEAPSEDLDYASYDEFNKITQNSAGDILFDCIDNKVHIYVSNEEYTVDFLDYDQTVANNYYIGTLNLGS